MRDKAEGVHQSKQSVKGMPGIKLGHQEPKVHDIEKVGTSGPHGVQFGMPTDNEISDHSVIKRLGA